jgi:hypothetical protein
VRGSRVDYAVFCVAGIVTALAYLWLPSVALLILGLVVAVPAGTALIVGARRGGGWRQHQALIRQLWIAANRIPPGHVLADPGTGELLSVERERGWLILVVTVPPRPGRPEVTVRYVIGHWGAPVKPPMRRRPADPAGPAEAVRAGPAEVSTAELARLVDLVLRTAVLGSSG